MWVNSAVAGGLDELSFRLSDAPWGPGGYMVQFCSHVWSDEQGQDIAEYAVMLAVILVLVIGTVVCLAATPTMYFPALQAL